MAKISYTDMGGVGDDFQGTHWTQILSSQTEHEGRRQAVLNELIKTYWRPVYCYLRRKGYDNEAAKDLVQGFFHEVVLGRELIQQADPLKGRFRTFLLTALDRYVVSVHRGETAKKRAPEGGVAGLDGIDWNNVPQPASTATPADSFNQAWASALLDGALADLEQECRDDGRAAHWDVFHARFLKPIMTGEKPTSLSDLCAECGVENEKKASNIVVSIKRRFRTILRHRVQPFVESDEDIDDEINDLIVIFGQSGTA